MMQQHPSTSSWADQSLDEQENTTIPQTMDAPHYHTFFIDPAAPMSERFYEAAGASYAKTASDEWDLQGKLKGMARSIFRRAYGLHGHAQEDHEMLCEEVCLTTGCSRNAFCQLVYGHTYSYELVDLRELVPNYQPREKRARHASERGRGGAKRAAHQTRQVTAVANAGTDFIPVEKQARKAAKAFAYGLRMGRQQSEKQVVRAAKAAANMFQRRQLSQQETIQAATMAVELAMQHTVELLPTLHITHRLVHSSVFNNQLAPPGLNTAMHFAPTMT
jgi:hypothetical protein